MYFLTLSFHVADLFGLNVMRLALGGSAPQDQVLEWRMMFTGGTLLIMPFR